MRKFAFATIVALVLLALMIWTGCRIRECPRLGDLTSWGTYLTGTGTVLLGVVAVYAAIQGLTDYRNRTRTERLRLLTQFYEKFYENGTFRQIRQRIDFEKPEALSSLMTKARTPKPEFSSAERKMFDSFTDYLNFFEMLAYLGKQEQVLEDDIDAMFGYYLKRLVDVFGEQALLPYLKYDGFERLRDLLVKYCKKPNVSAN